MTRDEVLERLQKTRAILDAKIAAVPAAKLTEPSPGRAHSVRDIVVHLSAYEMLIVERLRAARRGETTEFDRDRESWEIFNERVWAKAHKVSAEDALAEASHIFADLIEEVGKLSDAELTGAVGVTEHIDTAWLEGKAVWELIGIDCFDHYELHYTEIDEAAGIGPEFEADSSVIDIPALINEVPSGEWRNEVLSAVNDSVVRLGVIQGEYHWHAHASEDEFFMALDGELLLDLRDGTDDSERTIILGQHQAYTVPAGIVHRTRALERTSILMVEQASVVPAGDAKPGDDE